VYRKTQKAQCYISLFQPALNLRSHIVFYDICPNDLLHSSEKRREDHFCPTWAEKPPVIHNVFKLKARGAPASALTY